MGRPPTPPGTYGTISTTKLGPKRFRATAYFRRLDGTVARVERTRASETAAGNALKDAMRTMPARAGAAQEISRDTKFKDMAALWLDELRQQKADGDLSANTLRSYSSDLKNWVQPYCGELRMVELTVQTLDSIVKRVRTQRSKQTAANVKKVLRGVCGFAVRHGALEVNLATQTAPIARGKAAAKPVTGLSPEERTAVREKLRVVCKEKTIAKSGRPLGKRAAVWLALPDVIDAMAATGVRIGEVLALSDESVVTERADQVLVRIDHHLVRDPELGGLVCVEGRKGGHKNLLLGVPSWSAAMFRRRKLDAQQRHLATGQPAPLFPSARDTWLDPDNVRERLRQAIGGVRSHQWRHTVSEMIDRADLPASASADQLGNTVQVIEKHYRGQRPDNDAVVQVLEGMWGEVDPKAI